MQNYNEDNYLSAVIANLNKLLDIYEQLDYGGENHQDEIEEIENLISYLNK